MQPRLRALAPIVLLLLFTFALLGVAPAAVRYAFPVLAALAAAALFAQSRPLYVQFCLWMWFLSPELRRLVDYRTAFLESSPLLLAPFLAISISGIVLLRRFRSLARPGGVPFACALLGILFGTVYGLTRYSVVDVGRGLVNWLAPVLFGFFLYEERARFRQLREAFLGAFLWGTLVTSVYGLIQFFFLPAWDEAWMRGLHAGPMGEPFPRQVRVFSTMNAPATLAIYLTAGLLLSFAVLVGSSTGRVSASSFLHSRRPVAMLAAPFALLALALTSSRSLWLALLCGVFYLAWALPGRLRLRVAAATLIVFSLGALATQIPGIHDVVTERLKSFATGTSDVSASSRISGHTEALATLSTEPFGEGMGSIDVDHAADGSDDRLGPHDSTLLEFLYALGGPGTLIYALGLGFALARIFFERRHTSPFPGEPFGWAMRATLLGLFAQCLFTSMMTGVPGFLVWAELAFALAALDVRANVPHPLRPRQVTPGFGVDSGPAAVPATRPV